MAQPGDGSRFSAVALGFQRRAIGQGLDCRQTQFFKLDPSESLRCASGRNLGAGRLRRCRPLTTIGGSTLPLAIVTLLISITLKDASPARVRIVGPRRGLPDQGIGMMQALLGVGGRDVRNGDR